MQLNLKIPYDNHFYKNIINCNTVKFLIILYLNKDFKIKVDKFKELFEVENYFKYANLKDGCISKILKDLKNLNTAISFKELKLSRKISEVEFKLIK